MKCKHGHVIVKEYAITCLDFEIIDGKLTSDGAGLATPSGRYSVQCIDCNTVRTFNAYSAGFQSKWVRDAYDAAMQREDE